MARICPPEPCFKFLRQSWGPMACPIAVYRVLQCCFARFLWKSVFYISTMESVLAHLLQFSSPCVLRLVDHKCLSSISIFRKSTCFPIFCIFMAMCWHSLWLRAVLENVTDLSGLFCVRPHWLHSICCLGLLGTLLLWWPSTSICYCVLSSCNTLRIVAIHGLKEGSRCCAMRRRVAALIVFAPTLSLWLI